MTQITGVENSQEQSINSNLQSIEQAVTGDNPYIFRMAKAQYDDSAIPTTEKVEPMKERTSEELVGLEPTFLQHESVTGIPFIASVYKLDKVYGDIDTKDRINAKTIDEYITKKIFSKTIPDTAEAAKSFIKELESKIGIKEYHDPYFRLEKLSRYIKAVTDFTNFNSFRSKLTKEIDNGKQ